MESVGVRWCLLVSGGVCWCQVESVGVRWSLLVPGGGCWCQVVSGGVKWYQVFGTLHNLLPPFTTWYVQVSNNKNSKLVYSVLILACCISQSSQNRVATFPPSNN